jgi:predicted DNA-binding transcriptional regulator AlpA
MSIHSSGAGKHDHALITEHLDPDAAIGIDDVARLFDVSRITVWRMTKDGRLPPPFYPRERLPRWTLREILAAREQMRMSPSEAKTVSRANKIANLTQSRDPHQELPVSKQPATQASRPKRRRTVQLADAS